jgi:hypothetical protein
MKRKAEGSRRHYICYGEVTNDHFPSLEVVIHVSDVSPGFVLEKAVWK